LLHTHWHCLRWLSCWNPHVTQTVVHLYLWMFWSPVAALYWVHAVTAVIKNQVCKCAMACARWQERLRRYQLYTVLSALSIVSYSTCEKLRAKVPNPYGGYKFGWYVLIIVDCQVYWVDVVGEVEKIGMHNRAMACMRSQDVRIC
jgi:hypothetical protein